MSQDISSNAPKRGRPRKRYAERDEQVRQNMRLYRARRASELDSLARALDRLGDALATGDLKTTFQAAAEVTGLWSSGSIKDNVIKTRKRRHSAAGKGA
jgi:hypothetical protein